MSPIRQLLALYDSYEVYATVMNPIRQLQKKKSSMSLFGHRKLLNYKVTRYDYKRHFIARQILLLRYVKLQQQ